VKEGTCARRKFKIKSNVFQDLLSLIQELISNVQIYTQIQIHQALSFTHCHSCIMHTDYEMLLFGRVTLGVIQPIAILLDYNEQEI
jgi:predicted nucleotidyltransferase